MPKTKISEFSSTPANNTDIDSINIAENCPPSGINDAIRELMSQLKDWQSGTSNDPMVIGSSGSLTLNQGTANGVAYLNGSKVVTSGSALTFDGTNLGVGTSSPAQTLHVKTSTGATPITLGVLSNSTTLPALSFNGAYASTTMAGTYSLSGSLYTTVPSGAAQYFSIADSIKATLDSSGNLGLGVTPSAWRSGGGVLEINASTNGYIAINNAGGGILQNAYRDASNFVYKNTGTASYFNIAADGVFAWNRAASGTAGNAITFTQAMTLDASGNLGVGVTSPSVRLHAEVTSSTNAGAAVAIFRQNGSGNNGIVVDAASTPSNYVADFRIANSSVARIDSSGNFLIGKTSTSDTVVGFGIGSVGSFSSTLSDSTNSSTTAAVYSTGASNYRFYVGMGGTVFATSTSISAISDQTLKTNIRDLETGLPEVMALKPRRFDWKNGDAQNVAGFVAQEVEEVLPELVSDYVYNKDEDGNEIIKKSLKMGDILPTLVKAIQEQQAIIDSLKARLDAANL